MKNHSRSAHILLILGAIIGISLAASGLLEDSPPPLGKGTIALVDGATVDTQQYLNYLDSISQGKRSPLSKEEQRKVLERMIDEELLLNRGVEIGLIENAGQIRKMIVQEMMQTVLSESASEQISDDELAEFYADNASYFTLPGRLHVQRLLFKKIAGKEDPSLRAEQAYQALIAGEPLEQVKQQYADSDLLAIPNQTLPEHKLKQYLGTELTALAMQLDSGSISKPVTQQDITTLLIMVESIPAKQRPLAEIKELVSSEYERRRGDEAVAKFVQDLRATADIQVDEEFLDQLAQATAVE